MLFKNKKYNKIIAQAKEYFNQGNLEESAKHYEEAFSIKVNLSDFIMYGYILIDLGQYQKSETIFQNMALDFDFTEINYALANIYERTNRKQDAIESYEKVLMNNSDFEQAHFSLAYIYDEISEEETLDFEDENVKKAIIHYKESIRLNSKNFWSYINLGSIYERFNYNDEALQYFLKAYEVDNSKEMVCYNLGVAYYKLKQYDKSLVYYLKELEKENPFKSTYYNLGILYKDGFKDYEKAKYYYLKGLEINNEEYNIWYNLGCIHSLLKDFQNAYECFKFIYYKNKKYLNYLDTDKELEEFRKTEYYRNLKEGL